MTARETVSTAVVWALDWEELCEDWTWPPTLVLTWVGPYWPVRDVREGMAEYWDLHRGESDPTLESRSDRISPVERQQGRIES